jgi:hypothetical protein
MADDLGYADFSCYGRRDYQTPHLDRLARQGVKFRNAWANACVSWPTLATMLRGAGLEGQAGYPPERERRVRGMLSENPDSFSHGLGAGQVADRYANPQR